MPNRSKPLSFPLCVPPWPVQGFYLSLSALGLLPCCLSLLRLPHRPVAASHPSPGVCAPPANHTLAGLLQRAAPEGEDLPGLCGHVPGPQGRRGGPRLRALLRPLGGVRGHHGGAVQPGGWASWGVSGWVLQVLWMRRQGEEKARGERKCLAGGSSSAGTVGGGSPGRPASFHSRLLLAPSPPCPLPPPAAGVICQLHLHQ